MTLLVFIQRTISVMPRVATLLGTDTITGSCVSCSDHKVFQCGFVQMLRYREISVTAGSIAVASLMEGVWHVNYIRVGWSGVD